MKEITEIRSAYFVDRLSKNEIAVKYKRSWATIDKIIESSEPDILPLGKHRIRKRKVSTDPVMNAIAEILDEEMALQVKKKQKSTAKNIYEQLIRSGIYKGSKRRMQELVKEVREQLVPVCSKGYLPLSFPLGSAAQVDHGEVDCEIAGLRKKAYLFVLSVPETSLRFCQLFPTKASEAWGEFHERSFAFFKGIFKRIIYDNDTVLVSVIDGKKRVLTMFGTELIKHYQFEVSFCNPASGNEKGDVENSVGYCRRNYLSGCPVFQNWEDVNSYLEESCRSSIDSGCYFKTKTPLSELFKDLTGKLTPLLPKKTWFQKVRRFVNSYQQVQIDNHCYSVPEEYLCKHVRVGVSLFEIQIFDGINNELISIHKRMFKDGEDSLMLDHYLEQLVKKPGALWDCKVVQPLMNDEDLLKTWEILMAKYPGLDQQEKLSSAQKEFIEILWVKRFYGEPIWRDSLKKAIELGVVEAAILECIIRDLPIPKLIEGGTILEKLAHIDIPKCECDLSIYKNLGR